VPSTRILNEQFDLSVRPADRLHGAWESSGDIIDRHSGKALGRVYGKGRTSAAAEEEVGREAERWLVTRAWVR
jgi:hypothetical protein